MEEIKKLEEQLRIAMLNSDVETLNELIDDSLIFAGFNGEIVSKSIDLEIHRTKRQKITKIEPLEQIIKMHGDCAVVAAKTRCEGTLDEIPISGIFRYTRIWAKKDDKWRIIAGSITLVK